MPHIRLATESDIPVIASLAHTIWNEYYPSMISQAQIDYMLDKMYSPDQLRLQMTHEQHVFYLVENAHKPVGYLSIQETDAAKRDYFLHKFYILEKSRRSGVGRLLFEHVLNEIDSRGASHIRLCVNRTNIVAINFYFKMGFTIEKTVDLDIGNGFFMNDFVMIKTSQTAKKGSL